MEDDRGLVQRVIGRAWGEVTQPLYRNALFLMASSAIGSVFGFVFWIVVLRFYELTDAGYAVTMLNTISFLVGIATLGLPIAIIRFLPETDDPGALVNTSLSVAGLSAGLLALVFYVGMPLWASGVLIVFHRIEYLPILVLTAVAFAFIPVLDQTAIGLRRADLATLRVTIFSAVRIPLPIFFAVGLGNVLGGTLGVYLSFAIGAGASALVAGFLFLPRVLPGYRPVPRLSRRRLRPMVRFSLGNWVAILIGSAGVLLLPLLIVNTLPTGKAQAAAVFYAAYVMASLLFVIPGAAMMSLYAEASQPNARRRGDERKAILLALALLAPGIAGVWILARTLIGLFDLQGFEEFGVQPLRILSLASIPGFLNGIFVTRARVRKRVVPLVVSAGIASGVTLLLGYAFLQRAGVQGLSDGLVGLAIAFVLGQAAAAPYLYAATRGSMEVEPPEPVPAPP